MQSNLLVFTDFIGIVAFALAGILAAKGKKVDPVGIFVMAFVTAFGGGIVRDLIINNRPMYWIAHSEYVWVTSQNKFEELGSTAVKVTVDAELSTTSSNPVQNKVITQSLNLKADAATVSSLSTNVSNLTSTVNGKVDKNGLEDRFTLSIEDSTGDLVLDVSEN